MCARSQAPTIIDTFLRPNVRHFEYKGQAYYDLLTMVYLIEKHPHQCSIFPPSKEHQRASLHKYEFVWECDAVPGGPGKLEAPEGFWTQVESCCRRFVIFTLIMLPCKMTPRHGDYHGNYFIMDRKRKVVMQVDPIGHVTSRVIRRNFYDAHVLEIRLRGFFQEHGYAFKGASDWTMRFGAQIQQIEEQRRLGLLTHTQPGGGYCSAWAAWIADLLLTYPDENPDAVLRTALAAIRKRFYFSLFIRNYIEDVTRKAQKVLKRFNGNKLPRRTVDRERVLARYLTLKLQQMRDACTHVPTISQNNGV